MDDLTKFAELLRGQTGEDLAESPETTRLVLTKDEFASKMMEEKDGQALLDLLEIGEWKVCERLGLCFGAVTETGPIIAVPRWKNLVAHLRIVNGV
jgi:hypothetical protein